MTPFTILTVSPHADDESLGAGATLTMLLRNGFDMVNLACEIGKPQDLPRRRAELAEAGSRAGFTTVEMEPLVVFDRLGNLSSSIARVTQAVIGAIDTYNPTVIVSPHLRDGHHGHEGVALGVKAALELSTNGPVWWMYGIWADLERPTTYVPYGIDVMADIAHTIAAYGGENARSAYDEMYPARAVCQRTLGSERVFGFGTSTASAEPYADLLTEVLHTAQGWRIAAPRTFHLASPVADEWLDTDISWWMNMRSMREAWSAPA